MDRRYGSRTRAAGFTLLEMIIAITIMAVLITFSNKSVQNALRAKVKIQEKIDDFSGVRDSLKVLSADLALTYHYRDIELEFKNAVQTASKAQTTIPPPKTGQTQQQVQQSQQQQNQATQQLQAVLQQWLAPDPYRVNSVTNFLGTDNEIHFITMHSARLREDSAQADFVKVAYFLADCRKPGENNSASKCLARTETPLVEGDIKKNGTQTLLLEDVKEFKLKYVGPGKTDWVSEWDTRSTDAGTGSSSLFPEAVDISLSIERGSGDKLKKVAMHVIAPLHFPNNVPQNTGASQINNTPNAQNQNGNASQGAIP